MDDSHKVSFSMTGTSFGHWLDFKNLKFCIMGKESRIHCFRYWHYDFRSTVPNAGADFEPSEEGNGRDMPNKLNKKLAFHINCLVVNPVILETYFATLISTNRT